MVTLVLEQSGKAPLVRRCIADRTQLEDQLAETSQSIGFSVKIADSIKSLKELLATDSSDLKSLVK